MYMIVTNDKYELPVAVFDSRAEVAEHLHISVAAVSNRLYRGVKRKDTERIVSIPAKISRREADEREKEYQAEYRRTHDRSEYFRRRYQEKKANEKVIDSYSHSPGGCAADGMGAAGMAGRA